VPLGKFETAGPIGRVIRDLTLPIVFSRAAKDGGRSMLWLQGHHIDFNEPAQLVAGATRR
jgi:FAD-dependent urate hydroxylase